MNGDCLYGASASQQLHVSSEPGPSWRLLTPGATRHAPIAIRMRKNGTCQQPIIIIRVTTESRFCY